MKNISGRIMTLFLALSLIGLLISFTSAFKDSKVDTKAGTIAGNNRQGKARLKVQFLTPQELKFSQTDTFTVKPEYKWMSNQWHLKAQTGMPDSTAKFVTVLMPYREGEKSKLPQVRLINKPGWKVIELTGKETRQIVAFRSGANPDSVLRIGNFIAKSDVAAAAYDLKGNMRVSIHIDGKEKQV